MSGGHTVLITADTLGGVFTFAIELAGALAQHRTRVVLATLGALPTAAQATAARAIPGLDLVASEHRLEWMSDPWDDVHRSGEWLLELERRARPDVVHLCSYSHGALPFRAPTVVVAHSCVLSWWSAVRGGEPPARLDRYRAEVGRGLHAARAVVAPTRAMLDEVTRLYGAPRDARVISNCRDPKLFHAGPKEASVLAVGRLWDDAKNLSALRAVAPRIPWPVRIAGSLAPPGSSATPPPAPSLVHLGELDATAIAAELARAAVYALPARYEPFGLSILEAALSGCALVLGDIPSLREIWGDAALYVPPDDTAALERALRLLLGRPELRDTIAARAHDRALSYSPGRMARAYVDLHAELVRPIVGAQTISGAPRADGEPCA